MGLEGIGDVVDQGVTGVGRPSDRDDIEAEGDLSQGPVALEEGQGSSCQFLLFTPIDGGSDFKDRFGSRGLGGADFDNYQSIPIQGEQVDFADGQAEVGREENIT